MRILDVIRRERLSILFIIGLLISSLVLVAMTWGIKSDISLVFNNWRRFSVERSEKVEAVTTLRKELGYGGMIHQFKNFVLRGDLSYRASMGEHLGGARAAIAHYRSLGVNQPEAVALNELDTTLQSYRAAADLAQRLVDTGASIAEVDRQVRIDDGPALAALKVLSEQSQSRIYDDGSVLSKASAINALRAAIGYGGMIHNFKNYVLRGDETRALMVETQINEAKRSLTVYARDDTNSEEQAALVDLRAMLDAYGEAIKVATALREKGESAATIDKRVRVDDQPAFLALNHIQRQLHLQNETNALAVSSALGGASALARASYWVTFGLMVSLLAGAIWTLWDRQRREQLLRTSEERTLAIVDNIVDGVIVADAKGIIAEFNKSAEGIFGYSADEVLGKNITMLMPESYSNRHNQYIDNYIETNDPKIIGTGRELEGLRKDGTVFPMRIAVGELHLGAEKAFAGIVADISGQKNLEAQLHRAQRMEAVGQLTGGIAHDFNNLMGVMLGNAEILLDQAGENEKARRSAEAVVESVKRGASLTQRLLAFSRQQALLPQPTVINDQIFGLEELLHRALGETIELHSNLGLGTWTALIDPYQFENVLINLSINARDAMPRGGVLTIKTANITLDEDHAAQFEDVMPGDYVKVTVSDTGAGMSPETLKKAFEPFFTTKDVGKGSGLGLSMVYGFAKQSNGHATINSEAGHGTTIELYLPRSEEFVSQEDVRGEAPGPARGSERILVVEDDEDLREIPTTMLRDSGYEVVEARNGKEAIQCLQDSQSFDLLFTDVVLAGGMNGLEIADEAKRIQPRIKVLFTSGYPESIISHGGKVNQDAALLNKPYLRTTLLEMVRAALDSPDV